MKRLKSWLVERWKAILIGVCIVVFVAFVVWKVPEWQVRAYHGRLDANAISKLTPQELIQLQKDLITAENNARVTLAQIIGGLVVLLGLYATFRNIEIARENVRVADEGNLTERFSKAIELLGSEKRDVRLGGIYALERIARDSQKDHWAVIEVLTAFVREQSRKDHKQWLEHLSASRQNADAPIQDKKTPADIQAAVTVIGRRKWTEQEKPHQRIDLSESFFENTDFTGANFCRADFNSSDLSGAFLSDADFSGATLIGAKLIRVGLDSTKFVGADLSGANFRRATFKGVKLNRACLWGMAFNGVNLEDADLTDADFGGDRRPTTLRSADLRKTKGLTWEQISTCNLEYTKLPPELEEKLKAERKNEPENAAYRAVALKPQIVTPSSSEDA
ncbi:MAG: pentapeptide repeat-containing protein [Blastocatellia bacterium]